MRAWPARAPVRGRWTVPALPEHDGPEPPDRPPLGRLLVDRSLITEEQLAAGLAEQALSGRPLGQVVVDLGFVPAALVAQALATQHGGLLQTEYGYATGFALRTPPPGEPEPTWPTAERRDVSLGDTSGTWYRTGPAETAAQAGEAPEAAHADAAVTGTGPALAPAPPPVEPQSDEPTAEPPGMSLGDTSGTWYQTCPPETIAQAAAPPALESAASAETDAGVRLEAAERALAERSRRVEELEAEVERLRPPGGAERGEPGPEREPQVAAHLAFVAGAHGYSMVEVPGPLPTAGGIVELPAESGIPGRHLVVRIGSANLPGTRARCAYLLPLD